MHALEALPLNRAIPAEPVLDPFVLDRVSLYNLISPKCLSFPKYWDYKRAPPNWSVFFCFLFETGSCYKAWLELTRSPG